MVSKPYDQTVALFVAIAVAIVSWVWFVMVDRIKSIQGRTWMLVGVAGSLILMTLLLIGDHLITTSAISIAFALVAYFGIWLERQHSKTQPPFGQCVDEMCKFEESE